MSNTYRVRRTEQFRFRLLGRWFRDPLIVLQLEESHEKYDWSGSGWRWQVQQVGFRDVTVEDLTTMGLTTLISPRDPDSLPICFRPRRKLLGGWSLVLMICDGAWDSGAWRPARLQDLMIKDGKIQGGLGLVRRGA